MNTYLPWFPLKNMAEVKKFYQERIQIAYQRGGYFYAICLKDKNEIIGYINMSHEQAHDVGYALKSNYWGKGFMKEAASAFLAKLKEDGISYITATHDRNNPRSGYIMQAMGMRYCYSYSERWMPKNKFVIFRLYDLSLDNKERKPFDRYWKNSRIHYREKNLDN